jgi:phospholipid/cholesterol/gamma-HCH transport system substrate-binding protein
MTPRNRNLMVGVIVAGALLALAWMILKFSSNTAAQIFNKGTTVHLVADRVDGLAEGSPVFYLGVMVGRVMDVHRLPDNRRVMVDAELNKDQTIPKNVIGLIRQQSQLSISAMINLEPSGTPATEPLVNGDQIPAKYMAGGLVPPEVTELANQAREQHLVQHVDETVVTVRTELEKVGRLLDQFNDLVGDPKLRDNLRDTVANVRETSDNLKKFSGRFDELANDAKGTMTDARGAIADARGAINQMNKTVTDGGKHIDDVSRDVGQRLTQIAGILERFQSVADKIDKGNGAAGQFVNDPRLYESLVDTSRELNETVKTFKRLADQWEHEGVSLKLGK